jgi:hypothetical protein
MKTDLEAPRYVHFSFYYLLCLACIQIFFCCDARAAYVMFVKKSGFQNGIKSVCLWTAQVTDKCDVKANDLFTDTQYNVHVNKPQDSVYLL